MSAETQQEYFVAKKDEIDGKSLSIFYAPQSDKFLIPKVVLRARSITGAASGLWNIVQGSNLSIKYLDDDTMPVLEPSTIERIKINLDEFLRTQPADELFVDDSAPEIIKQTLQGVQETLSAESQTRLANMLGIVVPTMQPDKHDDTDYLHTGNYI